MVSSERYMMIQNFLAPALAEFNLQNVWFQQDGTTGTSRAHCKSWAKYFEDTLFLMTNALPNLTPGGSGQVFKNRL